MRKGYNFLKTSGKGNGVQGERRIPCPRMEGGCRQRGLGPHIGERQKRGKNRKKWETDYDGGGEPSQKRAKDKDHQRERGVDETRRRGVDNIKTERTTHIGENEWQRKKRTVRGESSIPGSLSEPAGTGISN